MIKCNICDKKLVTPAQMEKHVNTFHQENTPTVEPVVEPVVVQAEPIVVSEKITLRFRSPVEVTINSKKYEGKIIEAPNIEVASEIVRLVRESAYGDILER